MGRDFRSSLDSGLAPSFDSGALGWAVWVSMMDILLPLSGRHFRELWDAFHRGIVFASARSPVAFGSMIQSLLCGQHMGLLALPKFQSRLLDGAGKRKRCQRSLKTSQSGSNENQPL